MSNPAGLSTMRRDVVSAYVLTAARIGAWVAVSAVVYRLLGAEAAAMVALVRATVGLLAYVSLGIGPAMVRQLSVASRASDQPAPVKVMPIDGGASAPPTLAYAGSATAGGQPDERIRRVYSTGEGVAVFLGLLALVLAAGYAMAYPTLHRVGVSQADRTRGLALFFGIGIALRVISEAPSGLLQVRGRIALDNLLAAGAEVAWAAVSAGLIFSVAPANRSFDNIVAVGSAFALSNFLLLIARSLAGRIEVRELTGSGGFDFSAARALVSFGAMVVVAQLAEFLYAPTDYILINRLLDPSAVADYFPAVQIDSGLLLLVTAVANVLLPKAAIAHAGGDIGLVRRYYMRGTLLTGAVLMVGAGTVWLASPLIFRLWLGEPMPVTQQILPLVLIHTVIGGSAAVGRSVLLGMGKVRAFSASVLLAGVGNVLLSYALVRHAHLGLRGIVLGTITVVVLRAGLWMPWYVLRTLRRGEQSPLASIPPTEAPVG